MKRTDITALFPDATEEQIKKLMDLNGSDINDAKKGGEDVKKQLADALAELEKAKKDQGGGNELAALKDQAAQLKSELDGMKKANELRELREKIAKEKNVPASLLTGETEESCTAQADGILTFAKGQQGYPNLRDGGEAGGSGGSGAPRDAFAAWAKNNL